MGYRYRLHAKKLPGRPVALVSANGGIYVAEFKAIRREDSATLEGLELATEVLYELKPPVKGI
jgi:hypothetical protein